jgi:hypothetical protein
VRVGEHAAIGDQSAADGGAVDLGGGQEAGMGEDRCVELSKKSNCGTRLAEIQVGLEEVADGADVLPVAVEVVGMDAFVLRSPCGMMCLPKSLSVLSRHSIQHVAVEDR